MNREENGALIIYVTVTIFFAEVLPKYKAGAISGDENLIKHYIGEMCFFRAYEYFNKVKKLGDFPIITEVQGMDYEALVTSSKKRTSYQGDTLYITRFGRCYNYDAR